MSPWRAPGRRRRGGEAQGWAGPGRRHPWRVPRTWHLVALAGEGDALAVLHALVHRHVKHDALLLLVVAVPRAVHDAARGVLLVARARHGDLHLLAQVEVLEGDAQRVLEVVRLARAGGASPPGATAAAKEHREDVLGALSPAAAALCALFAMPVVELALLGVAQNLQATRDERGMERAEMQAAGTPPHRIRLGDELELLRVAALVWVVRLGKLLRST